MTKPAATPIRAAAPESGTDYGTRADWLAAGRSLSGSASDQSWAFADWLAAGHAAWGAEAMREAAESTGAPSGKISNYLAVSKAYPPIRRRISLTFSHHLEVARLPDTEREQLLDRAEAGEWTRAEIRAAAREASLEVKNANLRRKVAELERALAAANADPRDAAKQAHSRLDAEYTVIRESARRAAGIPDELIADGILDGLHGNARRGFAKSLRRWAHKLATEVNGAIDRIDAAATRLEEGS